MDLKGKSFLLVGGAGLIGSHILDLLVKEDVKEIVVFDNFVRGTSVSLANVLDDSRVRVIKGDIRNPEELESVAQGMNGVFMLAALWLLECAQNPKSGFQVNIQGNFNVLEACRKAKVEKIVFSSSASVYGDALTEPMPEEHPLNNRTFYGATKVAVEQMLRAYQEMYKLDYLSLRYFNVYGPRQDYEGAYVSVIMKALDRINKGERPIVFGDGSQAYDFIYVKDVARANILAMTVNLTDAVFNISTGIKTTIYELVEILIDITRSELQPEYRPAPHVFVTNRVGDLKKASKLLGFAPQTSL